MFCSRCGRPLDAGIAFCAGCGAPVGGGAPGAVPTPAPPAQQYAQPMPYASWGDRALGYIIDSLFVFGVMIILYVVRLILLRHGRDQPFRARGRRVVLPEPDPVPPVDAAGWPV